MQLVFFFNIQLHIKLVQGNAMKWSHYTKLPLHAALHYMSFHTNFIDFLDGGLPKPYHLSIDKFGLILEDALKL